MNTKIIIMLTLSLFILTSCNTGKVSANSKDRDTQKETKKESISSLENEKKAENTSETKANIESETEQETIMESSEEGLESKLKKVIYEDELKRYEAYLKSRSDLKPPLYPIVIVNVVHVTPNNDINKVFVYIYENAYSFSNGIFKSEAGSARPNRYDIDNNMKIVYKFEPEDGGEYSKSVLEMTENNREIADKLWDNERNIDFINKVEMEELKKSALERDLKNFTYDIKDIPNYNEDVTYVDKNENQIYIIKNQDYEKLQEERKNIVPDDVEGVHWVYKECIIYDKKARICVEGIIDYSD